MLPLKIINLSKAVKFVELLESGLNCLNCIHKDDRTYIDNNCCYGIVMD